MIIHFYINQKMIRPVGKGNPISGYSTSQLLNEIGLAHFKIFNYGKVVAEFDNMLLDSILDLILGYRVVVTGENTYGALYKMDEDWGMHLRFKFEKGWFYFSFDNGKSIQVPSKVFLDSLFAFSSSVFAELEFLYPSLLVNENYIKLKKEIKNDLDIFLNLKV